MNILKIRMTLIPYLFLTVPPAKNVVTYMCKNSHFRLSFQKEHGKRVSTLFKFERQNLYHIYWSTRRQFSSKKSLLVVCKSLRLFVNTTSAVDKCSLPNRDNLMQPIHRILYQKLLFVNTTSAVDKCSLPNRDNLMQPIHMHLSQKLKTFY